MSESPGPAAPASGIPTFEELAADPEIAALLEFEPVPRKYMRHDGWTPELQRELIARMAATGALQAACDQMGKWVTGAKDLCKARDADSFRAAWDAALLLGRRRKEREAGPFYTGPIPGISPRPKTLPPLDFPQPGQVRNEYGEWEDEDSLARRAEEARDSIAGKLLRVRRFYLQEIADCPGKRAAFELLTELPVDWDKARALEPQPDEPYNIANQRQPDMILTAESGWSFGEGGYGPDKKAELRRAIDRHRAEEGLPPVEWDSPSPLAGEGRGEGEE